MGHQVVWFDLPVVNMDRAIDFYSKVLNTKIFKSEFMGATIGVFGHQENTVAGCLVEGGDFKPSKDGSLLYFCANGRLGQAESTAKELGAEILIPKHQIGQHGYRTVLIDPEGNRVALHSNSDS